MLDLKQLRMDADTIKEALLKRMDVVDFSPIFALDEERRTLIGQVESTRAQRKSFAKQIGQLRAQGGDWAAAEAEATALKGELARLEGALSTCEQALHNALIELPNYPDPRIPAGVKNNQVVRTWGERLEPGPDARDHVELSQHLGLVDYERTKLGGNGFWTVDMGLPWSGLCSISSAASIEQMGIPSAPPHLLVEECGYTAGQFPKFRDDVFHLDTMRGAGSFSPTHSETAVLNVIEMRFSRMIFCPENCLLTPCYRRKQGAIGRGAGYHPRSPVQQGEMFQFCRPIRLRLLSRKWWVRPRAWLKNSGSISDHLLAARDASASMAMTYDVRSATEYGGLQKCHHFLGS